MFNTGLGFSLCGAANMDIPFGIFSVMAFIRPAVSLSH